MTPRPRLTNMTSDECKLLLVMHGQFYFFDFLFCVSCMRGSRGGGDFSGSAHVLLF